MNLFPIPRMNLATRRLPTVSISTAIILCLHCFGLPLLAESEDKPAKEAFKKPGITEATLMPLLRGTWSWKVPKSEKGGMTDIILSFDDNLNVTGTAKVIDGGLVMSPSQQPAKVSLLNDVATGLKSPERGAVLNLPMPGIQDAPARLLLKAATQKKLDCLNLADTENPVKVTIVKTSDRFLNEIVGPTQTPVTGPPAEETQPPGPSAPSPDVVKAAPTTRPVLSIFQRLKNEQAQKPIEEMTTASSHPTSIANRIHSSAPSRPNASIYQRLKAEQATQRVEEKAPVAPAQPSSTPRFLESSGPRPVMSLYERLKAELANKAAQSKAEKEKTDDQSGSQSPSKTVP